MIQEVEEAAGRRRRRRPLNRNSKPPPSQLPGQTPGGRRTFFLEQLFCNPCKCLDLRGNITACVYVDRETLAFLGTCYILPAPISEQASHTANFGDLIRRRVQSRRL